MEVGRSPMEVGRRKKSDGSRKREEVINNGLPQDEKKEEGSF
jgi:hypothetical protein